MKAKNDAPACSSAALDARTGQLAGFEIPPREYQIAALVRLNRPPTNAVSRLPSLEQINGSTRLVPRASQDPVHGD